MGKPYPLATATGLSFWGFRLLCLHLQIVATMLLKKTNHCLRGLNQNYLISVREFRYKFYHLELTNQETWSLLNMCVQYSSIWNVFSCRLKYSSQNKEQDPYLL